MKQETKCLHSGYVPKNGEPRQMPIYQSTTFKYDSSDAMGRLFDLEDSTVPCDATIKKCMENKYSKSIKAYTGYDDLTYDVYVPYSAYEKAFDTCVGIGAIKLEGEEILDEDVEYTENDGETLDEQFEKMTGAKRTTVRVVSALLLLLIVAGVVFGTDAIMNFIKEFFG